LLRNAPPLPFYLFVGAAAAIQNAIPLPMADVAVLFAAFLVAAAHASSVAVFAAAWLGNTGGATMLYFLAGRYRNRFPRSWVVRRLLKGSGSHAKELRHWDVFSVFVAAFLPVRPLLPVYAGLHHIPFWRVLLPIGLAAALWYAGVVLIGTTGGANFQAVARTFAAYNRLFTVAVIGLAAIAASWWLVRRLRR
jgi:membrane protein DedA with SNARE-associated domain